MIAHGFTGGHRGDFCGVLPPASITGNEGYRWYASGLIVHRSSTGGPGEIEYVSSSQYLPCIQ